MIFVDVIGGSKSQKKHVKNMVEFCVKTLMPRMNLDVTVNLCKPTGAMGYCLQEENNRTFELEIDKTQSLRGLLETVAHEMVHVKQYARGELYQGIRVNKHRWQGEWLEDNIDYWDLPWEIEAHGREIGLFVRWAEESGLAGKRWTQDA